MKLDMRKKQEKKETTAAEGEIVSTQESYEATDHSIDDTAFQGY